jgi:hypothetical protein
MRPALVNALAAARAGDGEGRLRLWLSTGEGRRFPSRQSNAQLAIRSRVLRLTDYHLDLSHAFVQNPFIAPLKRSFKRCPDDHPHSHGET